MKNIPQGESSPAMGRGSFSGRDCFALLRKTRNDGCFFGVERNTFFDYQLKIQDLRLNIWH
jgi:hypothetical protein